MDWSSYYPAFVTTTAEEQTGFQTEINIEEGRVGRMKKDVEVADIGCGFGGFSSSSARYFTSRYAKLDILLPVF